MEVLLYDSTICRLCAEENANGVFIFSDSDLHPEIAKLINKYMPLKISNDGKYPCSICPGCNIQLEATMQFFDLVIAGQAKLRDLYKQQQLELKNVVKESGEISVSEKMLQTIVTNDGEDEILFQFLPDGNLYPVDHEQFLRGEGLDKPRRKRGRPPKKPKSQVPELLAPKEEPEPEISEDGKTRRRRKVPTRFKEAVQGKELERIFREEGVIDDESIEDDLPSSSTTKPEIIGHLETKGDLNKQAIVKKIDRVRRYTYSNHQLKRFRKRPRYSCEICGKGFIQLGRFKMHKAYSHKKMKYECVNCKERFEGKDELETHQKEKDHSGIRLLEILLDGTEVDLIIPDEKNIYGRIQCSQCSKSFVSKQGYDVHIKVVHENQKPYSCEICGKSFAYMMSLKSHLLTHKAKPRKGYPCDICGKVLNHPSSVIYHKQAEHNNGRRFVCLKCNKAFKHKQLLQRHQLVHTSNRPYECKTCHAQFKAKSNLLSHQAIHTGVKKYFCEECGQQFAHKTSLTLHYRRHTGEKPFQCTVCDKAFSQNGNLQEHMRIHTGVKPFSCEQCGKCFTTSSQFKLHLKRHTGERPWSCAYCWKSFLSKETWKQHWRRHLAVKPFTCEICNRGFVEHLALKKHLRIHTGEKPYSCDICNRAFSDCSNLSKHKKIHNKPGNSQPQPVNLPVETTENQVFYVTYENDLDKEATPIQTENLQPESEDVEQQIMEVTDEDGNPIKITTKDGQDLRVSTFDGEHLQVTTPDGRIVPIELSFEAEVPGGKSDTEFIMDLETTSVDPKEILSNEDVTLENTPGLYVQYISSSKVAIESNFINLV